MSLMLRNFEYLAGGAAGGQYPGADLSSKLTASALRTALGIGSYANDTAAGSAGLTTGQLYFNTTSNKYVLKS